MKLYPKQWLPHLKDCIPHEARRNRTSLYTIALEGWRRGLKLEFYQIRDEDNKLRLMFSLSNQKRKHYFMESCGDKITKQAIKICHDKALTYQYLREADVSIPLGKEFDMSTSIADMLKYVEKHLSYPLVAKPTTGSGGKGVKTNIRSSNQLKKAIEDIRNQFPATSIIIQQHLLGEEIRIYVIENEVIAAAKRLPANVVGDGQSTIIQLINRKNEYRKKIPHLYYRPIKVDNEVKENISNQGYTLDTILEKGERLFLRKVSNVSSGGDPIDVTSDLSEEQKKIAIRAVQAIPGLSHCGVDMIVNPQGYGTILELNTSPGIGSHLFPIEGQARDIPKKMIDYYFPETKQRRNKESNVYFNLQCIFDSLDGNISSIEIRNHPESNLKIKKLEITTRRDIYYYYQILNKYINKNRLNGYMKQIAENRIEIIIAHQNEVKIREFIYFIKKRNKLLDIIDFNETEWKKPVKLGFELIDGLNAMSLNELEYEQKQQYKEIQTVKKEINRLSKRIDLMENSHSWKITKPLRMISKLLK